MTYAPFVMEFPIDAGALADAAHALTRADLWPLAIRRDRADDVYWVTVDQAAQNDAAALLAAYAPGRKRGNWRTWLLVAFVVALLVFCLAVLFVVGGNLP